MKFGLPEGSWWSGANQDGIKSNLIWLKNTRERNCAAKLLGKRWKKR